MFLFFILHGRILFEQASYNTIVIYSHLAVHYILRAYLFYNWKFVFFAPLYPFYPPSSSHLRQQPICLHIHELRLVCLLVFLDSTYKRDHMVFIFYCLPYFTQHNALKTHPCCRKWQDFVLLYGWIILGPVVYKYWAHNVLYHWIYYVTGYNTLWVQYL